MTFLQDNQNLKLRVDGLDLLSRIPAESISCSVFDPEYRHQLDKMKFGNEGKSRLAKRIELHQMTHDVIVDFMHGIYKALIPRGYMFMWVDKFTIGESIHTQLIKDMENRIGEKGKSVRLVDLFVWDKGRNGLGKRSRRRNEILLVIQKKTFGISTWKDKGMPDTFQEKLINPRSKHPHRKPMIFTERLVKCVTNEGDYVLDPCAGSFDLLEVCKRIGRNFIGGDISPKYGEVELVKKNLS